ncbi:MAG: hypothetical protein ACKO6A_07030 [Bacteroidota bacterium]
MDKRELIGYVFLALSAIVFIFFVIKDVYKAILLKKKGRKAFGKVIGVRYLQGKDKNGQYSKALVIEVKADNNTFIYDCLNSSIDYPFGKVPIIYLEKKNGKRICAVDSWLFLLTDAIMFFAISLALTIPYFIVIFNNVNKA